MHLSNALKDLHKKQFKLENKASHNALLSNKTKDKIFLKDNPNIQNDKELFSAESGNPLYDLWEYNGDRKIKKCKICENKFLATGNTKTCSKKSCSLLLEKMNKNKKK